VFRGAGGPGAAGPPRAGAGGGGCGEVPRRRRAEITLVRGLITPGGLGSVGRRAARRRTGVSSVDEVADRVRAAQATEQLGHRPRPGPGRAARSPARLIRDSTRSAVTLAAVSRSVYIASVEGRTGKSAVALGLLDALIREVGSVGVFRPLISSTGAQGEDLILDLLISRPGIDQSYEDALGVSYETARA